jgi:aryl-alcohol dehydrogenase-like predicted oxidoreductase
MVEQARKIVPIASVQVPYSMILRDIEKELVPYCIQNEIGILAYSPLQRGVLTGKFTSEHAFSEGDHRASQMQYKPAAIELINRFLSEIKPLADSKAVSIGQLVLKWTLMKPGISAVLVGARNASQVTENARANDMVLTDHEINTIDDKLILLNEQLRQLPK